jgi:hypothetical protein
MPDAQTTMKTGVPHEKLMVQASGLNHKRRKAWTLNVTISLIWQ